MYTLYRTSVANQQWAGVCYGISSTVSPNLILVSNAVTGAVSTCSRKFLKNIQVIF